MFYDNFVLLCKEKGISPSKAAEECGINRSSVTSWKKSGYTPRGNVLQKIAEYFGVSVDRLIGAGEKEKAPAPYEEDTRSVEEILEQTKKQLMNQEGLMFDGGVASEEAIESILAAMKIGLEIAKGKTREEKEKAAKLKAEILAKAEAMDDD